MVDTQKKIKTWHWFTPKIRRVCKSCPKLLGKKIRNTNTGYCHKCRLKILPPCLGIKRPDMVGNKYSPPRFGADNHEWKGDKVGYVPLHLWVRRHRGNPTKCEHCDRDGVTGRFIHWANKSRLYKRDLDDWIRLCAKCHYKYDRKSFKKK